MDKNKVLIGVGVLAVVVVGVLIYALPKMNIEMPSFLGKSSEQIAKNAVDYINNAQLTSSPVSLVSFSDESGLVKIKIKVGSSEYDSYITRDEKLLFPSAIEIKPTEKKDDQKQTASGESADEIIAAMKKADKPQIEAFIVARCPFGLQMQRMIADAVKNIPSLNDYIKVKYIGEVSGDTITAMHGEAEAKENLRQICIREEQSSKYWDYVSCQMKAQNTESSCEKSTGIDSAKLNSCTSDPKKGVAYAKKDFDASEKYGASGSPTLIVNGVEVPEFTPDNKPVFGSSRSSDEIKAIVCASSNSAPSFCSTKLNTAQAATSFSETYAGSGSTGDASCN